MKQIEEHIKGLEAIDVPETKQPDFGQFWRNSVEQCNQTPLNVCSRGIDYPLDNVVVRDLTFEGIDGTEVCAWLMLPESETPVPAVIHYHGAGGSRGEPLDFAHWILAGCAVLVMDFRMQGGDTGSATGFDGSVKHGWWSLGIQERSTNYVYLTWTDCLRAVRVARESDGIDPSRLAVDGYSQGGGVALGMAALDPGVALCMADVPSSCNMDERIFTRAGGASGIADYLNAHPDRIDIVSRNLSYVDNINHAANIQCPVLVSCGLKDPICPPACVYAAYNKVKAPKQMMYYPFAGHEGGRLLHERRKLAFVRDHFFNG